MHDAHTARNGIRATPNRLANVGFLSIMCAGSVSEMDERAVILIGTVMEMIDGTLTNMAEDKFHAPAPWVLENWWHTLNAALQVGYHRDSKSNSLKATDEAESKKTDEDIQTDESFEV